MGTGVETVAKVTVINLKKLKLLTWKNFKKTICKATFES